MDYRTALRNAKAGATYLNARNIDWTTIDPDTLDMSDWKDCLLGKVFGSYNTGLKAIGLGWSDPQAVILGFEVDPDEEWGRREASYHRLTRAWKALLPDKLRDDYLVACYDFGDDLSYNEDE